MTEHTKYPLQSIETRYIGPTDTKPSSIKASNACGVSVTVSYSYDDREVDAHIVAMRALVAKLDKDYPQKAWAGDYIVGSTSNGYVFVKANSEKVSA